jgi:exodeoxyribonuclease VII small subunit
MSQPDAERTFEEIVAELEGVTEQLAGGQIGIEAAADLYERAEQLHAQARTRLEAVQARVDKLAARSEPDSSGRRSGAPADGGPGSDSAAGPGAADD